MIIEAKGTKQQPGAVTDPAQRYVLKSMEERAKTPFAVGLMLTGLFVYLKSLFQPESRADEAPVLPLPDEARAITDQEMTAAPRSPPPELDTEPVEATEPLPGFGSPSVGGLLLLPQTELTLVGNPEINLASQQPYRGWQEFEDFNNFGWAANDNVARFQSPTAGVGQDNFGSDDNPFNPENPDDGEDPDGSSGGNDDDDDGYADSNRAPRTSGSVRLMDVSGCAILVIGMSELLRNATDPDGDQLSVKNLAVSSGTLTQVDTGWRFEGAAFFEGAVTITYEITDGALSVAQTAHFEVLRSVFNGTIADDLIVGSMCADDIEGKDGDDNIDARGGNDVVAGGVGHDHIVAGDGNDVVFAGAGNDIVFAGAGNDHISGGDDNDMLLGESGDDIIFGDAGDDVISGGDGNDILNGGEGDDTVEGDHGDDILVGGAGSDQLSGGAGDDNLIDGAGADENLGGEGDDHVVAAIDQANDHHDGSVGFDTLDYSQTTEGVQVDLVAGTAVGTEIGADEIAAFEAVIGGVGDDHLKSGMEGGTEFTGGGGADIFEFRPSHDLKMAAHMIRDFDVGDRIRISKYDLFEAVIDEVEDKFERVYDLDIDDDEVQIRYRHDRSEELSQTIIEVDFNGDNVWETTIAIDGHDGLMIVEHV